MIRARTLERLDTQVSAADSAFKSAVLSDINSLKSSVAEIKFDLRVLRTAGASQSQVKSNPCFIYVRVKLSDPTPLGTTRLESLLSCKVLRYWRVKEAPDPAFKVKISETDLHTALQSGGENDCFVAVWRNKNLLDQRGQDHDSGLRGRSVKARTWSKSGARLSIGCWNCRRLSGSASYIQCLLGDRPGILVLSEHWLWLYELDKLDNICEGYAATRKADNRLTCESDGGRGCGGIGLLWHKSIGATPVSGISSDRISAVRFSVDDGDSSLVSIIGVYMPCSDQGLECYRDHLRESYQ